MSQSTDFMGALWEGTPRGAGIQIWTKDDKRTSCFPEHGLAASFADSKSAYTDVYVAAGLAARVNKPAKRRAAAADVAGIPGLWADLDVNGGPEAKTGAAPTREAALELAHALLEPTVLVNSGYGIQAWWLFDEGPWIFGYEAEREQAARLSAGFQAALRSVARHSGFGIDATHDLARLMRVPGTMNHKGSEPVAVELLTADGPRYTLESLGGRATEHMGDATDEALRTLSSVTVEVDLKTKAELPYELIDQLKEAIPEFRAVWEHRPGGKRTNWSMSHYDLSIASYCVQAGFADQEIANALRYHRKRFGDPEGKGERLDYLQRTIAKARSTSRFEEAEREAEQERAETAETMARLSKEGTATPAVTINLFTKILGGPKVKELVQNGRDPDLARFHLVLEDGREVRIGKVDTLLNQRHLRARFVVVTGHLPRMVKATRWDDIVQALLNAATVREDREDTQAALLLSWLDSYVDRRTSTDRNAACQSHDPFVLDGDQLAFALSPFNQWLRKVRGERMSDVDLKLMVEAAGFERRTLNYHRDDGRKSSRSYYVGPLELVESVRAMKTSEERAEEARLEAEAGELR